MSKDRYSFIEGGFYTKEDAAKYLSEKLNDDVSISDIFLLSMYGWLKPYISFRKKVRLLQYDEVEKYKATYTVGKKGYRMFLHNPSWEPMDDVAKEVSDVVPYEDIQEKYPHFWEEIQNGRYTLSPSKKFETVVGNWGGVKKEIFYVRAGARRTMIGEVFELESEYLSMKLVENAYYEAAGETTEEIRTRSGFFLRGVNNVRYGVISHERSFAERSRKEYPDFASWSNDYSRFSIFTGLNENFKEMSYDHPVDWSNHRFDIVVSKHDLEEYIGHRSGNKKMEPEEKPSTLLAVAALVKLLIDAAPNYNQSRIIRELADQCIPGLSASNLNQMMSKANKKLREANNT